MPSRHFFLPLQALPAKWGVKTPLQTFTPSALGLGNPAIKSLASSTTLTTVLPRLGPLLVRCFPAVPAMAASSTGARTRVALGVAQVQPALTRDLCSSPPTSPGHLSPLTFLGPPFAPSLSPASWPCLALSSGTRS